MTGGDEKRTSEDEEVEVVGQTPTGQRVDGSPDTVGGGDTDRVGPVRTLGVGGPEVAVTAPRSQTKGPVVPTPVAAPRAGPVEESFGRREEVVFVTGAPGRAQGLTGEVSLLPEVVVKMVTQEGDSGRPGGRLTDGDSY